MKRAILLLALISVPAILFLSSCSPPEFLRGNQREVTVHLMRCEEGLQYGMRPGAGCKGRYLPAFVFRFKLFLNEQTVVDKELRDAYRNCTIYDEDNWRCKYDEGSADFPGDFGMERGEFRATWMYEYSASGLISQIRIKYVHVSWLIYTLWEWYLYFTR